MLVRFFTDERAVLAAIIINALAIFFLCFPVLDPELARVFRWIEYTCVLFYVAEAFFKIKTLGFKGYWSIGWNRFDLVVLICSLPVLAMPFMAIADFRAATVIRLGRLFRLFRLLHMIPNRIHLLRGIKRATRASVGVFLALFLMVFMLSLVATLIFGAKAPEFFGNPLISFYTIFRVFTVEGWHEIPEAMATGESLYWDVAPRLFFMFTVLVCGIFGLSIANAVFVDEMVMDNTNTLEGKVDRMNRELREIKRLLADRSGPKGSA